MVQLSIAISTNVPSFFFSFVFFFFFFVLFILFCVFYQREFARYKKFNFLAI